MTSAGSEEGASASTPVFRKDGGVGSRPHLLFLNRLLTRSILTEEEQQAVLDLPAHQRAVRARYDFVRENKETSHGCLILSGLVGRFGQLASGARQITSFYIPGDMTDLHATVRPIGIGGLHSLTDVTILSVPHDAIRRLAARYPAVAEALWRDCMLDAAILMQRVVNVGRGNAAARLAHLFCEMAMRYGNGQQPLLRYDFPVTQEQLGEATAITSVHVNRTLRALREASLISFERGVVAINDWGRLVKAAEFNAEYLTGDAGPERRKRLLTV